MGTWLPSSLSVSREDGEEGQIETSAASTHCCDSAVRLQEIKRLRQECGDYQRERGCREVEEGKGGVHID